jgi:starch-binding outer membrane protein SusE/F
MKRIRIIWVMAFFALAIAACEKVADLPFYAPGNAPELTASATTIAPAPADSNNTVLTLNWSNPEYATDSANQKFIVEIDSAGRSFAKARSWVKSGERSISFTAKELNTLMLDYGFEFNKPYSLDVRVTSSYTNNNERLVSNTVGITATPYKIPPKVPLPTTNKLYIVGDATNGGWGNPVPTPTQELTRIDETTFGGIFELTGGKEYLILPLNGNWDNKFSIANKTLPGVADGGDFGFNRSDNFKSPAASGLYKIILDFQTGKYSVTPFNQQHGLPAELFIVGGATPGGWTNPVPVPDQKFTRVNATQFVIENITLKTGEKYLFLPENGNWGKKYGAEDDGAPGITNGGVFKPEGKDMPGPEVTGPHKIVFDLINNRYQVIKL